VRTYNDYQKVKELFDQGKNKCEISRLTNIPRGTVKDWLLKGFAPKVGVSKAKSIEFKVNPAEYITEEKQAAYSFILGEYLGDGWIRTLKRTYRLDIFNDQRYEDLNRLIENQMQVLFPINKVNRLNHNGAWILCVHNNLMPHLFPQHAKGEKWQRKIELADWQKIIIQKYPKEFIKGLIYSDGCIYNQNVNNKDYLRYNFVQKSKDITEIFLWALSLIGIKKEPYLHPSKQMYVIQNFSQEEVLLLSSFIPPKTEAI
jgi:hypothetical protein